MRKVICFLITLIIYTPFHVQAYHMEQLKHDKEPFIVEVEGNKKASIIYSNTFEPFIVEVEGNPLTHKEHLEEYYPFIEIITTYDKLFNGIAFKANPKDLKRLSSIDFIKAIYPAQTYEAISPSMSYENDQDNIVIPSDVNTTEFTGKGVKVAVVDTGIDYHHKDLAKNYAGGYDLIDLDDDPMETTIQEGIPTMHGTHVAGIIAANGSFKGVAPDTEIYAYRALGPGGRGSSVQVIAAMEQAINDGVDIINLSLGNSVNGPDYPTSRAVNQAIDLGVAVVIANGNDGPDHWTVGSPATAYKALSVGASNNSQLLPFLYEPIAEKAISIAVMQGSIPWDFKKDYSIINIDQGEDPKEIKGKIAVTSRSEKTFYEKGKQAQEDGAIALLIYNNEPGTFQGTVEEDKKPINIPVAAISERDGQWLINQMDNKPLYIKTHYEQVEKNIALFSSRGPVTTNWHIKPEIVAPGANILSTVPGGYQMSQGTSMAAPHVTGAIAAMKEAHPQWTNDQIIGALKTTAKQLTSENGQPMDPIDQGMGEIQLEKAIQTHTIIMNPLLSFGKIDSYQETKKIDLMIKNTTNKTQIYSFDVPKKQVGLSWKLPSTFKVKKNEQKTIPIELNITTQQLEKGLHQGWLTLNQATEKFQLPYLLMNQTADYPKTIGFEFTLKSFTEDTYTYKVYVVDEDIKRLEVNLYNPDTLIYDRKLLELEDLDLGINKGELKKRLIGKEGNYYALITVELENGHFESYETELTID